MGLQCGIDQFRRWSILRSVQPNECTINYRSYCNIRGFWSNAASVYVNALFDVTILHYDVSMLVTGDANISTSNRCDTWFDPCTKSAFARKECPIVKSRFTFAKTWHINKDARKSYNLVKSSCCILHS